MLLNFDAAQMPDFLHIELPRSKSESNRALLIQALSGGEICVSKWADCEDTQALQRCLEARKQGATVLDVGAAGTTMRFLAAFLSHSSSAHPQTSALLLQGSERMHQRPIAPLVEALRQLGADIEYMGAVGCPPLLIRPCPLRGGWVQLDAGKSSQYLSALMMLAPLLPEGLRIELSGSLASAGYAEMSAYMMRKLGATVDFEPPYIQIAPTGYTAGAKWEVEADYSAASYWYAVAALSPKAIKIQLDGLRRDSLQPDRVVADIFAEFGVKSTYNEKGILLEKLPQQLLPAFWDYDFSACPDIAQTLAVVVAGLRLSSACLSGLHTLRIKETDRIKAMQTELAKFGVKSEIGDDWLRISSSTFLRAPSMAIETYDDHRVAMSIAPLVLRCKSMEINNSEVVGKSYPRFWVDWAKLREG